MTIVNLTSLPTRPILKTKPHIKLRTGGKFWIYFRFVEGGRDFWKYDPKAQDALDSLLCWFKANKVDTSIEVVVSEGTLMPDSSLVTIAQLNCPAKAKGN